MCIVWLYTWTIAVNSASHWTTVVSQVDDNMSLVEYELVQVPRATPAAAVEAQ